MTIAPPLTVATRRVLVVDDESDLRLTMALLLEEQGWEVVEAANGSDAIAMCADTTPTVMVLDERMPGMTGIEVARRLRAEDFSQPIVLYSAYLTPDLESESHQLGLTPIDKANLSALMAALDLAVA